MKKQYIIVAVLFSAAAYSQVGVNTDAPKTTLDVNAKRDTSGNITDNAQLIGLQAPRLTRAELTANTATYGTDQKGALIYVTNISGGDNAGQRVNITTVGYYYFDGSLWKTFGSEGSYTEVDGIIGNEVLNATTNGGLTRAGAGTSADPYTLGLTAGGSIGNVMTWNGTSWSATAPATSSNIYNTSGSLTNSRTLTLNSNDLNFTGSQQNTNWSAAGSITQNNTQSGSGQASMGFSGGNSTQLNVQQLYTGQAQILASGSSTQLNMGTNATASSAPIILSTSAGSTAAGTEKMRITGEGNVGINTTLPTERFHNNGNVRLQGLPLNGTANAIYTQSGGTASATQNQTFTGTRTVVTDANGVFGYVSGLPTTTGSGSWFNTATGTLATANTQNIYQMGKVGVMTSNPTGLFHSYNNSSSSNPFTVESDNAGSGLGNDSYFYGYGSSLTPGLFFLSARGSKASPTSLQANDLMGEYNFGGYLNGSWNYSLASVRGSYDGNGTTLNSSLHLLTSSLIRMRIDANGNVGIGASTPKAKVHVQSGDIYIEEATSGIIMKSPNGSCWRVTVANGGTFASTSITCP
jgi:hypothetical protein